MYCDKSSEPLIHSPNRQTLFEIFEDEARKKKLAFRYTVNLEHEHILTDITKVKEIFVNILSNAIKYTPSRRHS